MSRCPTVSHRNQIAVVCAKQLSHIVLVSHQFIQLISRQPRRIHVVHYLYRYKIVTAYCIEPVLLLYRPHLVLLYHTVKTVILV